MINLDWGTYIGYCYSLVLKVQESGFKPDVVVGIARGGLIPAQIIAYALKAPRVLSYGVSSYGDGKVSKELRVYQDLTALDIFSVRNEKWLWVDDVCDSGKTVEYIRNVCSEKGIPNYQIGTVLIRNTTEPHVNYYGSIIPGDEWVNFPYDIC